MRVGPQIAARVKRYAISHDGVAGEFVRVQAEGGNVGEEERTSFGSYHRYASDLAEPRKDRVSSLLEGLGDIPHPVLGPREGCKSCSLADVITGKDHPL